MSKADEIGESLTTIANQFKMSEVGVSLLIKRTVNKILNELLKDDVDIFEACLSLGEYLGIEPKTVFKKLDKQNKRKLTDYAKLHYGDCYQKTPELRQFQGLFDD
jgi:hypothetical protein